MNPVGGIGGGGSLEQIIALRQQIIDRSKVLQEIHQPKAAEATQPAGAAAPSFGDSLRNALENVNAVQAESGRMTAAYERGEETDIAKVMLARQEAGVAFEATLQVRNKLLAAYQETMRMGI
ncbi:flagellar hook-basal body complex protein FliE [Qipengyuania qiaonensis]|uniref:Flagellar hook-basal body complex protein FliE n=1 Tax=Qipengyuania qiaonensis TaxID=2867240 RepID=A0ABS7JA62_9SPHN|nr:flagellar hook-basal body complex protein FliE [Qipengyuania qiaonensis]MBX7481872.1 flagellar hook-basal body complex protein FliE [Qipengyuania qiaonensis]